MTKPFDIKDYKEELLASGPWFILAKGHFRNAKKQCPLAALDQDFLILPEYLDTIFAADTRLERLKQFTGTRNARAIEIREFLETLLPKGE